MTRLRRYSVRGLPVLCVVAAATFTGGLAACGGEVVNQPRAEDEIQTELESVLGIDARSTDCPSDVKVEPGERFRCKIEVFDSDDPLNAAIKVLNPQADLQIIGVD